jgi:PAS domain S-box-containing protein
VSRRAQYLFVLVMVVQSALTLAALGQDVVRFTHGDRDINALFALCGVVWLTLTTGAAVAVVASVVRARRALHQQAQAMATTEALSSDWLWTADAEYRLTYCSDAVRSMLGYEPSELLGRTCEHLVMPEVLPEVEALVERNLQERGTPVPDGPLELPWRHADGHPVIVQGSTSAIYDEKGAVVGYRGTRRLLTDAMVAQRSVAAAAGRVTRVLSDRAVDIALQPIIDLTTGRLSGVEALARFRDGRPADVWFREAAEAGMALDLDRLTFLAALDLLPMLPETCLLSINATPELLIDDAFRQRLLAPDLPGERLIVEITEHVRISSYDDIANSLAPLRERGIRLAVDDTGAGFASLSHVLQLRPDIIKIDRSLVSNVTSDAARRSVITSLVLLALDLGASVTAEGVETPSELETLATMGADHVQGYLLARPTTDRARWARWWDRNWLVPNDNPAARTLQRRGDAPASGVDQSASGAGRPNR